MSRSLSGNPPHSTIDNRGTDLLDEPETARAGQCSSGGVLLLAGVPASGMTRGTVLGTALTLVGLVGYVTGVAVDYPGREFSVTAVMTGIVLVAIARRPTEGTDR